MIEPRHPATKHDRNARVIAARQRGLTFRAIAATFGISEGRVRQIVKAAQRRHELEPCPQCHGSGYVRGQS